MATYYCKCGRVVNKSTNATTTGNRDTAGCEGCPYLLPYGPYKHVDGQGFVMDAQGYECRMTNHPVDYATHSSSAGGPNDKTSIRLESLDFDFLEDVTNWVKETYLEGELTGGFDRQEIRGTDYLDGVRVSFYPSQNKKGAAAKQVLFRRFFHPDGTRLDMTQEEEKAKILADIEAGLHPEEKEVAMELKAELTMNECAAIIKHIPEGWAFHQKFLEIATKAENRKDFEAMIMESDTKKFLFDRDFLGYDAKGQKMSCRAHESSLMVQTHSDKIGTAGTMVPYSAVVEILWPQAQEMQQYAQAGLDSDDFDGTDISELHLSLSVVLCLENAGVDTVEELADMADEAIMRIQGMGKQEYDEIIEKLEAWSDKDSPSKVKGNTACACAGCIREDCTCAGGEDGEARENCSGDGNCQQSGCSYAEKHRQTPTSSATATAAADKPVESSEPAALTPTTETAANVSEQAGNAPAHVPALGDMPAVFDYSGLDEQTVSVMHMAETEIQQARQGYIIRVSAAVAAVHEAVVGNSDNSKHGKRGDETFTGWCAYVGIKRDAAYRFLQVEHLLTSSTPEEAAQLEQASPSLLYAAAKPSAPAELVQAVKDGDITTHKEFQAAMAKIKTLEDENKQLKHENEMERKEQEGANAAAMRYKAECDRRAQDQQRLEGLVETANQKADLAARKSAEAWEQAEAEKAARKTAEAQTAEIQKMYDTDMPEMQRFIDKAQAERDEYKALLEAGQSTQLTATVTEMDQEEINRRAQEIAEGMLAEKIGNLEAGYPLEDAAYDLSEIFVARWDNAQMFNREIRTRDDWTAIRTLQETLADMVKALDDMLGNYETAGEGE